MPIEVRYVRAAAAAGKPIIGESAIGRGKGSPFAFADPLYSKHVKAFTYPPIASFNVSIGATAVYSEISSDAVRLRVDWCGISSDAVRLRR